MRYVNREIDLESLTLAMDQAAKPVPSATVAASAGEQLARSTARQWQSELARRSSWDRVQAIMERLRSEFHLDRHCDTSQSADPLADFLSSRRGNDLMFATAAAVMLQELGYQTRLVTGLMARRENRLNWARNWPCLHPILMLAGDSGRFGMDTTRTEPRFSATGISHQLAILVSVARLDLLAGGLSQSSAAWRWLIGSAFVVRRLFPTPGAGLLDWQ